MNNLNLHPATRENVTVLLSLIRGLAAYEKKPQAVVATEHDLLRDAFGPHPKFRALIADWKGEPAGYASFFHFYSTYQGRSALFLEDLFVLDKFRGNGIGMALLSAVAKLAVEEGCFGLRWEVLDWNHPAIEFYKRLGATFLNEREVVAFDEEALRRVAGV
ncbi:MAG TPA: GNAT family N-acetyltransferase [Terriglobales bacterium]|jgi:GNAT superfamily N-acetyltransferase|nr:GNAT family N-acetyltransferase [Terriglobales bacterium]